MVQPWGCEMSADKIVYNKDGQATSFTGPAAVNVFAMAVLVSGLRLYASTKMLPNRRWTAKTMMKLAEYHTGQKFKARDYLGAADALSVAVQSEKVRLSV